MMKDDKLIESSDALTNLDDEMLTSVSGGCTSPCGGRTTRLTSCVPPNEGCP